MSLLAAYGKFAKRYGVKQVAIKRDAYGVYGIEMENRQKHTRAFFVYKKSMYGDQVSVHKDLVLEALHRKMPIFMAVEERVYRFLPEDIIAKSQSWENTYNGSQMLNFSIKLGVNVEKLKEIQSAMKKETEVEMAEVSLAVNGA